MSGGTFWDGIGYSIQFIVFAPAVALLVVVLLTVLFFVIELIGRTVACSIKKEIEKTRIANEHLL